MSDPANDNRRWVVCKFGGTSVSSAKTWKVITDHCSQLLVDGFRVCLVVSAVSQVTNHLEKLVRGLKDGGVEAELEWIKKRHQELCAEVRVDYDALVKPYIEELERLIEGMRLTGDIGSPRLVARVLSFGEIISSNIGEHVLRRDVVPKNLKECHVGLVDARKVLISNRFDDMDYDGGDIGIRDPADVYLNADVAPFKLNFRSRSDSLDGASTVGSVNDYSGSREQQFLGKDLTITQGFIASTGEGVPCILGRGGSDTSGAYFAAALSALRLEIWTDVDGMYSSDPNYVPNAMLIEELSYREAQELAAMGAKVLHPRCLGPASAAEVVVEIHNTMNIQQKQLTRIVAPDCLAGGAKDSKIMAITRRRNQVLLTISTLDMWGTSGFLSRVFAPFTQLKISVDLIATSQYAVSMTLDYIPGGIEGEAFGLLIRALKCHGNVVVEPGCTVVSVVGRKLRNELHGMADAFRELKRYDLLLFSESTEDLNMSFVLGNSAGGAEDLVRKLHEALLESHRTLEHPIIDRTRSSQPSSSMHETGQVCQSSVGGPIFAESVSAVTSTADSRAALLDPQTWVVEALKHELVGLQTPFCVLDIALVSQCARKIKVFSLSWSENPAVLRVVFQANSDVIFYCRSVRQLLHVSSVVGEKLNAYLPHSVKDDMGKNGYIPSSVRLVENAPDESDITFTAILLRDARVLVSSIVDTNDDRIEIDAWFPFHSASKAKVLTEIDSKVRLVEALSLNGDTSDTLLSVQATDGFEMKTKKATNSCTAGRIALSGIVSIPFSATERVPVREYIRYQ